MAALSDTLKNKINEMPESNKMLLLALVVGLCSGLAAVILKYAIHYVSLFLKSWFNGSSESWLYLVYPGLGMLVSFLFVRYIVKDNISHGVTKVLKAVAKHESKIKGHNVWSSLVSSSLTIGFGGSVGAEAPIVYTGAAIGSNLAQKLGLSYKNMTILLGCGAAGAVAGIFKAPLAGILFTLEILMFNISMTSIVPLLVSAVTATTVSFIFLGESVVFTNSIQAFNIRNIPFYIILGVVCGAFSLYFMRTTLFMEDKIRLIKRPYLRWMISALSLGLLIFLFPPLYGEGYDSLTSLLNNNTEQAIGNTIFGDILTNPWAIPIFFLAVLIIKVLAMSLTNAGGGVGGTFGPTLIVGGLVGFVFSRFVNLAGGYDIPEANFTLVGMAGLMAGVMQAPMTAIFLIAEITGGYVLLLPLIIASVVSFATMRRFETYSIYTKRIAKQGDLLTHDSDKAVLTLLKTADLIETDFISIEPQRYLRDLVNVIANCKRNIFPVVTSDGYFAGIILLDDIRHFMFDLSLYDTKQVSDIMVQPPAYVYEREKMESVMKKFEDSKAWNLPVIDLEGHYRGFVSKSKIFFAYREQLQQVSHE
ncbi:Putative chloride channel protein ClcB-like protein [Bacteroidales bacterium CF]|nr:Putative chloride channel protein ClcB-like protein [Bacteroidales bacterium CF]NCB97229.1 chloride channel protein [Bacteroidia bacterium]